MKMVPSALTRVVPSAAERKVFQRLLSTDLGVPSVGYHSVNLGRHDYKLVSEIDFIVLTADVLLVLEVKGGRVACHDGIWIYTDRFDEEHRRSDGPFEQARSAMYSLRRRLGDHLGSTVDKLPCGYGVVVPDCLLDVSSVEWVSEMCIDSRSFERSDLAAPLNALRKHIHQATKYNGRSLSADELLAVQRLLRPDFDRVPGLRGTEDLDAAFEHLTEEQFIGLDYVDGLDRLLFVGGAGTGKTFLAAEAARRHAASGESVLFLTGGANLAAMLKPRLSVEGIALGTWSTVPEGAFDVLVIDEGQDIMNSDGLARLDRSVRGGLAGGRWRIFLDDQMQHSVVGSFDPECVELLQAYGAHRVPLHRNCRNTPEIVDQTRVYTGGDMGAAIAGRGPKVSFVDVNDEERSSDAVQRELDRLISEGANPGQITVLSPVESADAAISGTKAWRKGRVAPVSPALSATWPVQRVTFASVAAFKGMENRFIVLTDLEMLPEGKPGRNMLYVAMSRARAGLSIVMTPSARERLGTMALQVIGEHA
jgi:hypothetical protein